MSRSYNNAPNGPPPAYSPVEKKLRPSSTSTSLNEGLSRTEKQYYQILKNTVIQKKLQSYYKTDADILNVIRDLDLDAIDKLASTYGLKPRAAKLLVQLSLFDIILYVDNSASMNEGDRIDDLEMTATTIVDCYFPFDVRKQGISMIFMNGDDEDDFYNIRSKDEIMDIVEDTLYFGETPLATVLSKKILSPIKNKIRTNVQSFKPTLIISLTDGSPTDKNVSTERVINDIKAFLQKNHKPNGVFFQFAQIGNDLAAADFLQKLDENPVFGDIVDVTSSYDNERKQVEAKGGELNKGMWTLKLLLGAIDNEFDVIDEAK